MKELKPQTRYCKICFQPINNNNLLSLLYSNNYCSKCLEKLKPKFHSFVVDGYKAIAIYDYDETIQHFLYQYKGCFDRELNNLFINKFKWYFVLKYKNYEIVPIPSYIEDDEKRGFNHVEEIFKNLGLPILKILEKTEHFKQADHTSKERTEIYKYLRITYTDSLINKKILIVDDVYTTGSTMKSAINLVKQLNPKEIKILVMSKTTYIQN